MRYPHHDAVNGVDCALYAILFETAYPNMPLEGLAHNHRSGACADTGALEQQT